jgi:hypothetical protein
MGEIEDGLLIGALFGRGFVWILVDVVQEAVCLGLPTSLTQTCLGAGLRFRLLLGTGLIYSIFLLRFRHFVIFLQANLYIFFTLPQLKQVLLPQSVRVPGSCHVFLFPNTPKSRLF